MIERTSDMELNFLIEQALHHKTSDPALSVANSNLVIVELLQRLLERGNRGQK